MLILWLFKKKNYYSSSEADKVSTQFNNLSHAMYSVDVTWEKNIVDEKIWNTDKRWKKNWKGLCQSR